MSPVHVPTTKVVDRTWRQAALDENAYELAQEALLRVAAKLPKHSELAQPRASGASEA
jgi:hypothetical protein